MVITAGGVGLPHLDQRAGDGPAVAVKHPAVDDDPLAQGFPVVLAGEVVVPLPHPFGAEQRAGDLGEVLGQGHQGPVRCPQPGAPVVGPGVRGVGAGVVGGHASYGRPT